MKRLERKKRKKERRIGTTAGTGQDNRHPVPWRYRDISWPRSPRKLSFSRTCMQFLIFWFTEILKKKSGTEKLTLVKSSQNSNHSDSRNKQSSVISTTCPKITKKNLKKKNPRTSIAQNNQRNNNVQQLITAIRNPGSQIYIKLIVYITILIKSNNRGPRLKK